MLTFQLQVDHIGSNGLCVAGFFMDSSKYEDLHNPDKSEQDADPLFVAFKQMVSLPNIVCACMFSDLLLEQADDQSWLDDVDGTLKSKSLLFHLR